MVSEDSIFAIGSCHISHKPQSWIACFDDEFQLIWKKELPENPTQGLSEQRYDKILKNENGIVIFGAANINGGQSKIWKFSRTDGIIIWENLLNYYVGVRDFKLITDGFLITGSNESIGFVKKFDFDGQEFWSRIYDLRPGFESSGQCIFELNDGSRDLIFVGNCGALKIICQTYILRLNRDGNIICEYYFPGGTGTGIYDSEMEYLILGGCTQEGIPRIVIMHQEVTLVQDDLFHLTEFRLEQNYPNPFNATTTIRYQLPKSAFVILSVYDISGRLMETLVNEHKNAGYYAVQWNTEHVGSGIYLYRIDTGAGEFREVRKCLVVK